MPHRGPRTKYQVCVVGLGYVGLPTACALAESGLRTVGVDMRMEVVDLVNAGRSPFSERDLVASVRRQHRAGMLTATSDVNWAVGASEAVIVAVQTPFEHGRSNLGYLEVACEEVAAALRKGSTVILESTVPPGTSSRVVLPIFKRHSMLDGTGFFFAYCPERIAPGDSLREFKENERIIGADRPISAKKAIRILGRAVKGRISFTDLLTAETTKLVENAARDVYIAFANDLAKMSARIGVDAREVIKLANTHPRVKILNPGPGVGGPCLTKDSYLLLEGIPDDGGKAGTMIRIAREVNDSMRDEVLSLVRKRGIPQGAKVAVLGTSYKAEVDDPRSSPSEPIIAALLEQGYEVHAYDPHCKESFGALTSETVEDALGGASCALILVAHRKFRTTAFEDLVSLMGPDPVVIDAAGVYARGAAKGAHGALVRLGDGRRPDREG